MDYDEEPKGQQSLLQFHSFVKQTRNGADSWDQGLGAADISAELIKSVS